MVRKNWAQDQLKINHTMSDSVIGQLSPAVHKVAQSCQHLEHDSYYHIIDNQWLNHER